MGHYKGWTAAALIFGVSEVVLELLMPMLMSAIVDGGLYREDTFMLQGWFSPELIANRNRFVLTVGAIMVGVACLSMAMGVLAARCSAIATQGFARNMRGTLLGKIESFSFANIDHISTPQLITRATTDINTLRDTMRQSLVTLYRAPVMVILATAMSFIVSPRLAPLLLACIPLLAVVMTLMMAPGHLLLPILQCLVIVQSISLACALVCLYATLMSLSSPLQAGVDFTLFQCTDAAIAILAGVIGGVVAQHFGYAACFLFAGAFTLLAAWVAYIRLHSARELMTSAID